MFDPITLIKRFNKHAVRYLLIGRQAVVQYGAPLFSLDYDFWISPESRDKAYEIIESFGLVSDVMETSSRQRRPIAIFDDDEGNKVDVFFTKAMASQKKDITILFEDAYARSVVKKDPASDFFVRLPCIGDLIRLKQLGDMAPKDHEDVEYLKSAERQAKSKGKK